MKLEVNKLVGADESKICEAVFDLFENEPRFKFDPSLYGDGRTSERIAEVLEAISAGSSLYNNSGI